MHHHGHGHRHRALAVATALDAVGVEVTGLSSGPRPSGWAGSWHQLPDDAGGEPYRDRDAAGWLHHVPLGHPGLAGRMAAVATWLAAVAPVAMVVDVSVEIAVLARLHGVPVVSVAMPGTRTDRPHRLGYGLSTAVIGPWPSAATALLHEGQHSPGALHAVGAISRYRPVPDPDAEHPAEHRVEPGTVLVLQGSGGSSLDADAVDAAAAATPDRLWTRLGGGAAWVDDPWPRLCAAEVVVSHCGQNALAEIAAARRPAVLLAEDRPFAEQHATARAVRALGLPAVVLDRWPEAGAWPGVLGEASALDGADWVRWNDGGGAERAAAVLGRLVGVAR